MQKPDFLTDEQWAEVRPWIIRHFACMVSGMLSMLGALAYLLLSQDPNRVLFSQVGVGASVVGIRVGTWLCNRRMDRIRQQCLSSAPPAN